MRVWGGMGEGIGEGEEMGAGVGAGVGAAVGVGVELRCDLSTCNRLHRGDTRPLSASRGMWLRHNSDSNKTHRFWRRADSKLRGRLDLHRLEHDVPHVGERSRNRVPPASLRVWGVFGCSVSVVYV